VPQLVQPLHSVHFKLTLSVRRVDITTPIISIANTKMGVDRHTNSNSPMSGIISVCNASYSKGIAYKLYNVPKYRTYLKWSEVANVI